MPVIVGNAVRFVVITSSPRPIFKAIKDKLIASERMKEFSKDMLHWKDYDYVVINDDLQKCFNQICKFIESFLSNSKIDYDRNLIKTHINKLSS